MNDPFEALKDKYMRPAPGFLFHPQVGPVLFYLSVTVASQGQPDQGPSLLLRPRQGEAIWGWSGGGLRWSGSDGDQRQCSV